MVWGKLMVLLLMFLSGTTPELCTIRSFIDVLEGNYFLMCFPESERHNLLKKNYTVNWYQESQGRVKLIQGTDRIALNGTSLEFWPVEVKDSGNYTCSCSNGTHNVTLGWWSLHVLGRSNDSCFNPNYVLPEKNGIEGKSSSLECPKEHNRKSTVKTTWYKNCVPLKEGEALHFKKLEIRDSGNYTCVVSTYRAGKIYNSTSTTELKVAKDSEDAGPRIMEPVEDYVETEIGKEKKLLCKVFLGYSDNQTYDLYWMYNKQLYPCSENTNGTYKSYDVCEKKDKPIPLEGKIYVTTTLRIKSVKEEDLNSSYTCYLITGNRPQNKTIKLKKGLAPDLPLRTFTTGMIMAILFSLVTVLIVVVCVAFRVDLVLFYRDITGKDDTIGDGKEYDAFVSYLKDCVPTCGEEREFALEILPKALEGHFGYKLCIFERDVSPGGAVVDDVNSLIDKSRRLIIILSKNYISDKVMYELESGLHKALVERKIKIILIEFMPVGDFNFLPKSLDLLSSSKGMKWKEEKSLPLNSRFWKNLRYKMPAKVSMSNIGHQNNSRGSVSKDEPEPFTVLWGSKTIL
uniref:Interleukin 18 receptor 1 n=1 Tax=Sphenodon punctatus TaxID=8508 RepID=A0A8D0GF29_SPHPU